MTDRIYQFQFAPEVELEDIEASIVLSLFAVESLHGESQALLDSAHCIDARDRVLLIDISTQVGKDLARIFMGFLRREIPQDCYNVKRIRPDDEPGFAPPNG